MSRGLSMSTVRRYIKSSRVQAQLRHGKYWVLDEAPQKDAESRMLVQMQRLEELERELAQAREEVEEMKMLVAAYEEIHRGSAPSGGK